MSAPAAVYRPRNPQDSDYYRCVEDYFETFIQIYDEHFSWQYGFWRPYVEQVIYRYLDCGDLHNGFAISKNTGKLPEVEHPVVLTDIQPFKWLSVKGYQ